MKTTSSTLLRIIAIGLMHMLLFLSQWNNLTAQTVAINEIMASNASTISDEDGDFEDWIEIHNYGSDPLHLEGFGLSDDFCTPFKWVFPDVSILPGEFILVWASGKNRINPSMPLHTNFSIKAEGEEVLLTHPSGTTVDEVHPIAIPTDISYGRQPDGTGEWFFFDEPTPGESNINTTYSEILDPPVFSHPAGFYTQGFELNITHPDPEVTIVFTLDGSYPTPEKQNGTTFSYKNQYPEKPGDDFGKLLFGSCNSFAYHQPLIITDHSANSDTITRISTTWHYEPYYFPDEPVFKGTVVRAIALKENAIGSKVESASYFITEQGRERYSLPVVSIQVCRKDLFDYEDGIYVAGIDYDNWRSQNPDAAHNWQTVANFHRRGDEAEMPVNVEFFEADSHLPGISQLSGFRIHGGEARRRPMKSFRLYARSKYGDGSFNHKFFNELDHNCFKRLLFRNSGQDFLFTMIRDATIHRIFKDLHFDTQAYEPVVVFINGEYWGIHNLRERYDKFYFNRVYGVDPENIDYLTNNITINEGDVEHYNETLEYISQYGLEDDEHYHHILTRIDVENFRDYQIANVFASNTDWPGNNLDFWRLRTSEYQPDAPYGHDGRWRWILYDMDFAFGLWEGSAGAMHNTLAFATATGNHEWPNPEWSTFLLRSFLENPEFRNGFINRFADLLNTHLLPERIINTIDEAQNKVAPEMPEHILRWKTPYGMTHWQNHVSVLKEFAEARPTYQRNHIADHFHLEGEYKLTLDVSNRWHGHIRVNTIDVKDGTPGINGNPYPWTGIYFKDIPIEVEAIPAAGYAFSHWKGLPEGTPAIASIKPVDNIALKAHFVRSDQPGLVYYWCFGSSLPNDTPLEQINATFPLQGNGMLQYQSALEGYPFFNGHPNWRKASMERRNAPTAINYRPEGNSNIPYQDANIRGLQVKQPFAGDGGENTLIFHLPSVNYKDLVFRFAAKDEGAADMLVIDYSVDPVSATWIDDGITSMHPLDEDYHLYEIDFTEITAANDNPGFLIRIRFAGQDMTADGGNRVTFNNFSLDGKAISANLPPVVENEIGFQQLIGSGLNLEVNLHEIFSDPDNDSLTFTVFSTNTLCVSVSINNNHLIVNPVQAGGAMVAVLADDGFHDPVATSFRVLVHPEAYKPGENNFSFTSWDPNEPEYIYPPHMLFLQSDENEPGLDTPLLYPYYIPHDDYHSDDEVTIGFPYNNTRRTRINGLGENGISFINTGRGRDLGGALLAVDTRGIVSANLSWLGGTILENSRKYGIRLQYRTHIDDPFSDLLVNGEIVEYIAGADGDVIKFDSVTLPQQILDKEYVQLLWRYYHVEGISGPRSKLRLDEIRFTDLIGINEVIRDAVEIYSHGSVIHVHLPFDNAGTVFVYDITGRLVHERHFNRRCSITLNRASGIYIVRVVVGDFIKSGKVFVR